jgi:hypothetical protein
MQYPIEETRSADEQLDALGITLGPCPPWCLGEHFGPQPILFADDGYFHNGPITRLTDSSATLGDDGEDIELELGMASWAATLAAAPGPTLISMNNVDNPLYFTPERARQLADHLTRLADQAETP